MQLFLSGPRYFLWQPDGGRIYAEVGNFYRRLLDGVQLLPGVRSVALVSWLPMSSNTGRRERSFRLVGQIGDGATKTHAADFTTVSEDYFKTLQIPLLQGRPFNRTDSASAPWVAIVNRAFALRYWRNENPLGKQLLTDGGMGELLRQVVASWLTCVRMR